MWQCFIPDYSSLHYLWINVVFIHLFVSFCSKKAKSAEQEDRTQVGDKVDTPSKLQPEGNNNTQTATTENSKDVQTKGSKEAMPTQKDELSADKLDISVDDLGKNPPTFDLFKIKQFTDNRSRDSTRTDLRSVQDLKFMYNPKNPLGALPTVPAPTAPAPAAPTAPAAPAKPAPAAPKKEDSKPMKMDRTQEFNERLDDREFSVLTPANSFMASNSKITSTSSHSNLKTTSLIDPLSMSKAARSLGTQADPPSVAPPSAPTQTPSVAAPPQKSAVMATQRNSLQSEPSTPTPFQSGASTPTPLQSGASTPQAQPSTTSVPHSSTQVPTAKTQSAESISKVAKTQCDPPSKEK